MVISFSRLEAWIEPARTPPRLAALSRNPLIKADVEALLFSAKSFAAAMLAYFIALNIGLPRPSWAIVTAYLVSQPSAGASFSRGVYRLIGTLVGAAATVVIVPTFANEPMVCSAVLAGWIGLGLFLSLLDRTPRAYAFVLSGYTTSLIGFPAVAAPGAVFDTASVRVQEIALGILCAVLVHRYVLPRPMSGQFQAKLASTLRDVRNLAGDVLDDPPKGSRRDDRYQLTLDLLALRGLATHLPYDPVRDSPRSATLRRLHDRLARLLPLLADIEEQIAAIHPTGMPDGLARLLRNVRCCIALDIPTLEGHAAKALMHIRYARSVAKGEDTIPSGALAATIARHLADLVGLLRDVERLRAEAYAARHVAGPLRREDKSTGYVFHRDPKMAARAGLGAAIGIFSGCLVWIWSAWPDGGLAVSVLGVTCALFGNVDAPVPHVRKYLLGSLYGVAISLGYSFVVLPRVFDFSVLIAVLAPAFLFAGSLQARPATAFMALGMTLTIPILVGLGPIYGGDFAEAINSGIAMFLGIGFGAASMALLQTVSPDVAINRLLYLGRRDVVRQARGSGPAEAAWTGLMVDRIAILLPRLSLSTRPTTGTIDVLMCHLRIGHAVSCLRGRLGLLEGATIDDLRVLVADLAEHFDGGAPSLDELSHRVKALIASIARSAEAHPGLLDPLIDLWFALSPIRDGATAA